MGVRGCWLLAADWVIDRPAAEHTQQVSRDRVIAGLTEARRRRLSLPLFTTWLLDFRQSSGFKRYTNAQVKRHNVLLYLSLIRCDLVDVIFRKISIFMALILSTFASALGNSVHTK